ncbi:hypothetical protein L9F63_020728, partial [Diploptera punctata]
DEINERSSEVVCLRVSGKFPSFSALKVNVVEWLRLQNVYVHQVVDRSTVNRWVSRMSAAER